MIMQLKPQTLMVAVQCVASETRAIDKKLQNNELKNGAEIEQLLVTYDLAAEDLKAAYIAAYGKNNSMPTYEDLINSLSLD